LEKKEKYPLSFPNWVAENCHTGLIVFSITNAKKVDKTNGINVG
jgi:hypothetical protein